MTPGAAGSGRFGPYSTVCSRRVVPDVDGPRRHRYRRSARARSEHALRGHAGGPGLAALAKALLGPSGESTFDIMVPGRYDLALNRDRLNLLTAQAKLPWTIANLTPRFTSEKYRIVERNGVKVGLTGVVDDRLAPTLHPRIRPEDLVPARKALADAVRALREAGADIVVAVSHQARDAGLKAILRLVDEASERPDVLILSPITGDIAQIGLGRKGPVVLAAPSGGRRALVAHVEVRRGVGEVRFLGARRIDLQPRVDPALGEVRREVCEALGRPIGPRDRKRTIDQAQFVQFVLELIRRRTGAEVAVITARPSGIPFPSTPRSPNST